MTEINRDGQPIGKPLVAKESKFIEEGQTRVTYGYHRNFVKVQMKAARFAKKFNQKLDMLKVDCMIPRITFLACSVYFIDEQNIEYLAEERLDYRLYKKWNNNAGGVDGVIKINRAFDEEKFKSELQKKAGNRHNLITTLEEDGDDTDGDDTDGDDYDEEANDPYCDLLKSEEVTRLEKEVIDDDIPQAFTHFTYVYSKRNYMVCDLQGELKIVDSYPWFAFTDPCIHRRNYHYHNKLPDRYGRTNRGNKGMQDFFRTHHCNPVCELLRLKKNY
jgi:hypothetical protein